MSKQLKPDKDKQYDDKNKTNPGANYPGQDRNKPSEKPQGKTPGGGYKQPGSDTDHGKF